MANERLKPFRDYSEHDVINLFAFGDRSVSLGTTDVVYAGSCVKVQTGWSNTNELEMLGNVGVETALVIPEFQPVIQAFFKDFFNAVKNVYSSKYSENVANELAERAVAEIEGSLLLARIFNDNSFFKTTHKRLVARLQ